MAKKNFLDSVSSFLIIVAAILVGITGIGMFFTWNFNIMSILLSKWSWLQGIIYVLVGAAGGYKAYRAFV